MHLNTMTWSSGPKHGATTANTRKYIDFAAANGFKGVLVEGWNIGWDGNWIENKNAFTFTKAYPDYDLPGLAAYAKSKGVGLIAHNETSGGHRELRASARRTRTDSTSRSASTRSRRATSPTRSAAGSRTTASTPCGITAK